MANSFNDFIRSCAKPTTSRYRRRSRYMSSRKRGSEKVVRQRKALCPRWQRRVETHRLEVEEGSQCVRTSKKEMGESEAPDYDYKKITAPGFQSASELCAGSLCGAVRAMRTGADRISRTRVTAAGLTDTSTRCGHWKRRMVEEKTARRPRDSRPSDRRRIKKVSRRPRFFGACGRRAPPKYKRARKTGTKGPSKRSRLSASDVEDAGWGRRSNQASVPNL